MAHFCYLHKPKWIVLGFIFLVEGQSSSQAVFPQAFHFNSRAASINGILVANDTIACVGVAYKDNDSLSNQQGVVFALVDSCGNQINYHKYFDEDGKDMFITGRKSSTKTKDGGYCFGGALSALEAFTIKTNNLGEMIFYKKYTPPFSTDFYYTINSILEIEGNLYVFGLIQHNNYDLNIFLMKTDALGNSIFFKEYGISEESEAVASLYPEDDKIIVGAFRSNTLTGDIFAPARNWVFELDTLGNVGWEKLDSVPTKFWSTGGLQRTKDNGWIYGSAHLDSISPWGSGHYFRCAVVKLDSAFNQQWATILGNPTSNINAFADIIQTDDGGYIAGGTYITGPGFYSPPPPYPQKGGLVVKLSSEGDTLWSNFTTVYVDSLGRSSNDLVGLEQLSSGTLIAGGGLYDFAAQKNEGWVTKIFASGVTDADGGNTCGGVFTFEAATSRKIWVHPNPVQDKITLTNQTQEGGVFRLWSVAGVLQAEHICTDGQVDITFPASNLGSGLYFWVFEGKGGHRMSGKVLKL